MNGRANNFPINLWGLISGLMAAMAIALSGKFTMSFWNLPVGLADFLKWFGWALSGILFVWLFLKVKKGFEISAGKVVLVSAILSVPYLLTYSVLAGDVFAYIANIKITALGNPYILIPSFLGADPILKLIDPVWQNWPSAYGPLWQIFCRALSFISQRPDVLIIIFKLFSLVAVLLCAFLIAKISRPDLAALFAWSPIVLLEAVGDAHNDIFIALGLVLTIYWLKKPIKSALALAAAIAIKYIPILILPGILFNYQNSKRHSTVWKYLATVFVVLIITLMPYWAGVSTFRGLESQNGLFFPPVFSPQSILYYGSYFFAGPNFNVEVFARTIGLIIFFGIFIFILYRLRQKKLDIIKAVFFILAAYLFFAAAYVQTWYLLWLLPLALFLEKPKAVKYTATLSIIWAVMLIFAQFS